MPITSCCALLLLKSEVGVMCFYLLFTSSQKDNEKINFIRNCVLGTPKFEKCAFGMLSDCMYLYCQSDSVLL
jgi:hypothetical protein